MISAFKRLVHTNNNNGQVSSNNNNNKTNDDKKRLAAGVQHISSSLQKKFSKGVQYNMKIIIRGDKNVGKTCLFSRLQGDQFKEEYSPTEEIQVCNIEWNYNVTDDKVKVEIWEIVDKSSKKRKPINELKLNDKKLKAQLEEASEELGLDAQFIDVYKNGTNGVILMFDLTKNWTFEYIEKEIENIPKHIPIIILGNHIDQSHHGLPINKDKVQAFIETIERDNSGQIRYAETSMRNGFGLKFIYKWFNLPFLHLKQQSLIKQLETNEHEIIACCLELNAIEESDDQNYERFLYTIQNRRREIADKLSQIPASTTANKSDTANNLTSKSVPFNLSSITNGNNTTNMTPNQFLKPSPSIIIGANNSLPIPKDFNYKNTSFSSTINTAGATTSTIKSKEQDKVIDETEDQVKLRAFLEDAIEVRDELAKYPPTNQEIDSEDELDQPKILSYQEELDSEDQIEGKPSSILVVEDDSTEISKENNEQESNKIEISKLKLNDYDDDSKETIAKLEESNQQQQQIDKKVHQKSNGHSKEHKKTSKKHNNDITINLVDSLPDRLIDKSHHSTSSSSSSKTKNKIKKVKKSSSSDKEKLNKKKSTKLYDLIGQPYIAPIDEGPSASNNTDDYFEL